MILKIIATKVKRNSSYICVSVFYETGNIIPIECDKLSCTCIVYFLLPEQGNPIKRIQEGQGFSNKQ